ncbi:hypothetical protein AAVH_06798 [Aphelenchoides avenae]|nr:hypothetical protein AAVH_06798 [Aphelenchus avenae]
MSDVCLRQVYYARVGGTTTHKDGTTDVVSRIRFNDRPDRDISNHHEDHAHLFAQLVQALRSSHVETLCIGWFTLTPALATLVLQTPIVVHDLKFREVDCAELTPTQFQDVVLHFSPTRVVDFSGCPLRACQLTDEFLRVLSKNSSRIRMEYVAPVDGGSFHMTDDAVVDFCAQQDVGIGNEGDTLSNWKPYEELILNHGSFTKDLFRRLVEASAVSMRTQTLRITVGPLPPIEDVDLRDFAQHLSYRRRDGWDDLRVYDFPDQQNGMHLQIKMNWNQECIEEFSLPTPGDTLVMVRARRPNRFFYKPHE